MADKNNKPNITMYLDWYEALEDLTDDEVGIVIRGVLEFVKFGKEPEFDDRTVRTAYRFITNEIRVSQESYEKKSRANSENGKKGGAPAGNQNAKKTTENNRKQPSEIQNNRTDFKTTDEILKQPTISKTSLQDKTRQDKTRQDKTKEEKRSQDTAPEAQQPPQPDDLEFSEAEANDIVETWNHLKCTQAIGRIKPNTDREAAVKLLLETDRELFFMTLFHLDDNEFFIDQAKKGNKVKFDWFIDPDNFEKVADGNYKTLYAKGGFNLDDI